MKVAVESDAKILIRVASNVSGVRLIKPALLTSQLTIRQIAPEILESSSCFIYEILLSNLGSET